MNKLHHIVPLGLFVAFGIVGCGTNHAVIRGRSGFYPTAKENYDFAIKELRNQNWLGAQNFFQHVKANFSYTKWATHAELGLADVDFGREKYIEAVDEYRQFIRIHPNHEHVLDGYASFRVGETYARQIPTEWFLSPPSYEKDQGPVLDALRELRLFVDQYPQSPHLPRGKQLVKECIKRLTDHELYVARFYLRLGKPAAAVGRLEDLRKTYSESEILPEALVLLGRSYLELHKNDEARATFQSLLEHYPDDYHAEKARRYLAFLECRPKTPNSTGTAAP